MEEFNNVPAAETAAEVSPTGKFQKTWHYTEKTKKHTINHTIILTKERYTHQTEINTASHAMKSRTDLSVKNVHSVHTFYGLSKNIGLAILMFVLAAIAVIAAIVTIGDSTGTGIVLLLVGAIFGIIGYFVLRRIKPAFMLQINTVILGKMETNGVSHGNISAAAGANASRGGGLFALIGNLFRSIFSFAKPKYKFEMPPEVGNDIVDTIGALLIEE